MKTMKMKVLSAAMLTALGLAACNDDGSAPASATTTPKSTTGVITGFGSVFVNGVEYELDTSTSVSMDGAAGDESQLEIGMVVTLEGTVNADGTTGLASAIKFTDEVEGYVVSNAIGGDGTGTLNVMGLTVTVTADTKFESADPNHGSAANLVAGDIVEVSGYSSGDGNIFATRIEVKAGTDKDVEVKGVVANLDTTAKTFTIGSLTVDYSSASEVPVGIANGLYVEIKADAAPNPYLVATKVEMEDDGDKGVDADEGEELELEGLLTAAYSEQTQKFGLNGQDILVSADTEFEDDGSLAALTAGVVGETKLKIEGEVNAEGVLVAKEIKLKKAASLTIKGLPEAVDIANGTITIAGQTIKIDNSTLMNEELDAADDDDLNVGEIAGTDWVELSVYTDANGNLVATKLERDDDAGASMELEGVLQQATNGDLSVGGVALAPLGNVTLPLGAVGVKVEVKGSYDANIFTVTSIVIDS